MRVRQRKLVGIVGPTASGKSALAIALARAFDGEIVSCDSTAVYRGLDIGTDKPTDAERAAVPHHLIDVAAPTEVYSAARFAQDAGRVIHEIVHRGRLPIVAGGTGFYLRAIARGLDTDALPSDPDVRARLEAEVAAEGLSPLLERLDRLAPTRATSIDRANPRRVIRALEIAELSGRVPVRPPAASSLMISWQSSTHSSQM